MFKYFIYLIIYYIFFNIYEFHDSKYQLFDILLISRFKIQNNLQVI